MERIYEKKTLYLVVVKDDDFLSPYWAYRPIVSDEAASAIDNCLQGMSLQKKDELVIEIASDVIVKSEQKVYAKAIHTYYRNRLSEEARKLRHTRNSSFFLFMVGMIVLVGI